MSDELNWLGARREVWYFIVRSRSPMPLSMNNKQCTIEVYSLFIVAARSHPESDPEVPIMMEWNVGCNQRYLPFWVRIPGWKFRPEKPHRQER